MMRRACLLLIVAGAALGQRSPLHTEGRYIVDSGGKRVKLAAVNWYGAEEQDFVVAGLDYAPLTDIAHRIATMGFNAVRLPWSNQMFESNPAIADARLAANPSLKGSHALDVLDAVVAALAAENLYVILDNHTSTADWCCSTTDGNGFWYNGAYPESSWLSDWQGIAKRYAAQPAVIGADLRNEPRGPVWGGSDARYDWRSAAERGGNAVLDGNPNLLIFVEGINYAADLTGVSSAPVRLKMNARLVYSSHDYSWFHNGVSSYAALKSQLDAKWGFLLDAAVNVPVWVGEFGTCHTSATCVTSSAPADSGFWFANFLRYLQERDIDWSYWALNGTEASATGRTLGAEETFGILTKKWTPVASAALLNALQAISAPAAPPAINHGGIVNPADFRADVALVPGSLASIFGTNLAPVRTEVTTLPAPSMLGGAQVQMSTGTMLPIVFASPGQVNIQIPWETDPAAPVTIKSIVGILASGDEPIHLGLAGPAIFPAGTGTQGAVVIANTSTVVDPTRPAHRGDYLSIFCTGLGAVTNQPATGAASPGSTLAWTLTMPVVSLGAANCTVIFSGLAPGFLGLYQVNVQVPPDAPAGDRVPLTIAIGGAVSNPVMIAVAP